jgi:glycosyltransferase involved in cell wall biosynthesis
MMTLPTLTVLMPNYNHGAFIAEALESIARQSARPDRVLVADDGSTDDSLTVLKGLQRQIPSLEVIVNERNRGVVATCRDLIARADTECVFFTAADDKILPGFFEATLDLLDRHPAAGLCATLSEVINAEGDHVGIVDTPIVRRVPSYLSPTEVRDVLAQEGWFVSGNATVYRRGALRSSGSFREELGPLSDGFAAYVVALTHGACFVPRVLAAWRRLDTSYSARYSADVQRSDAIRERAVELMRTEYSELFPGAYIERFEKEMRLDVALRHAAAVREGRQARLATSRGPARALGALLDRTAPLEHGARVLRLRRRLGLSMLEPFRRRARRLTRRPIA